MSWFYFEVVSTYSETVTRGVTVYESHVLNVSHGHGLNLQLPNTTERQSLHSLLAPLCMTAS